MLNLAEVGLDRTYARLTNSFKIGQLEKKNVFFFLMKNNYDIVRITQTKRMEFTTTDKLKKK